MCSDDAFLAALDHAIARGDGIDVLLRDAIQRFGGQAGTVHFFDAASGLLRIAAHAGIPESVVKKAGTIPIGKGIAGLAAQRREPVQVCNLQTDDSGVAQPGAKATQMQGSVAVPMIVGGELRGTLGVAKATPHIWSERECDCLMQVAARLARCDSKKETP